MNYSDNRLSEECPLTKDGQSKYSFLHCCKGGFNIIVSCFAILTFSITAALIFQLLYGDNVIRMRSNLHGAVATDYVNCSQIGSKILRKGGNAIDAAIAATLCMTVVAPHKTGLGSGGYMMIYNHKDDLNPVVIDFASDTDKGSFSVIGERIPAVLKGLEAASLMYGKLPWQEVVLPAARLARTGFVVSKEFADEIIRNTNHVILFGHVNAGDILRLDDLADTLEEVAHYGAKVFYNGTLSHKVLRDDIVHEKLLVQLANYKPHISTAMKTSFYGSTVYYPVHSQIFSKALTALGNLKIAKSFVSSNETLLRVAKTLINLDISIAELKKIEQERYTEVVSMDWQDNYACIITGLSSSFGLGHMTSAGFLLDATNNNNFSSFTPIIFRDQKRICGLRGIYGGDDAILNSQILYDLVMQKFSVSKAIEQSRYYLLSDGVIIERRNEDLIDFHTLNFPISRINANTINKSINIIMKHKDSMMSHSDSHGGGISSRF